MIYPDKLTDALTWALGRPNFWCGPLAAAFRAAGEQVSERAEDEQAFVIHFLVKMILTHGETDDAWWKKFQEKVKELRDIVDKKAYIIVP